VHQPTDDVELQTVGRLTPDQVAEVTALVDDATDIDGVRPLSEHVMLHLRYGGDEAARNLLVRQPSSGRLAAYAHLDVTDPVDGPSTELVVAPDLRRHGYGRALIAHALADTDGRLRLWAHGDLPEASLMAAQLGFHRTRVLLQMQRSLSGALPRLSPPEGVTIRTFNPRSDDEPWLALNALAFAHHPEQGSWTLEDLHQRMHESWFDPAGFFLAEREDRLVGFHWTKVHGGRHDHPHEHDHEHDPAAEHGHPHEHHAGHGDGHGGVHGDGHGHEPIGEVYVLGVDPAEHGHGLGRVLTVVGLRHLRASGLPDVMLYVDESNTSAIRLYESLGFSRWNTDVLFRHDR
jgi:mycothiol synthase